MRIAVSLKRRCAVVVALAALAVGPAGANPRSLAELWAGFQQPPDDSRIMMRWWWFGPAVTQAELEREMRAMKSGGIGGFEVAVVNPTALDDPGKGVRNFSYLSDEFLDDLRFTATKAAELGLRMDVTLGSGWPLANPEVTLAQSARRLGLALLCVPADPSGRAPVAPPVLAEGESLVATLRPETSEPKFLISTPTKQSNVAAAVGAKGLVIDHYSRDAVEQHLRAVGDPLLRAMAEHPPFAVFSDSLEVARADWTPRLLEEFKRRRGYDLTPYLPALGEDIGEATDYVRCDWGRTLTELAEDNFLSPISQWAAAHHTRFRAQNYGSPPLVLSSNVRVDLAEGELGFYWRQFSPARWASSANHLYGRAVTSTETWTWLHSPVGRATPLDLKAEADLHFLQGANQLIGHGWPYSAPGVDEPGWSFYAAGNFSDHNPWWPAMPSLARYLQRLSFLLREGTPGNDVAVYVPTSDIYAAFKVANDEAWDHVSVSRRVEDRLGAALIPTILDAGYNFDFIDDEAIRTVGLRHPILILHNVERIPFDVYRKISTFAHLGGKVIALRRLPALAPGWKEKDLDEPCIRELSRTLFAAKGGGRFLPEVAALPSTLRGVLVPQVVASPALGFVHRGFEFADIFFVVNTTSEPLRTPATFRARWLNASAWDPRDGTSAPLPEGTMTLELAPYESRVIVFSDQLPSPAPARETHEPLVVDLGGDWDVRIGSQPAAHWPVLRSWTDDLATRNFSGEGVYEKRVTIPPALLAEGRSVILDLGEGTPVPRRAAFGMQALLESPVREVATVVVNGNRVGVIWCPPYRLDVTRELRAGENRVRIVVANTAINAIAAKPPANFQAVRERYGSDLPDRYYNDDDLRRPLPSGLLGPVRLISK